MVLLGDSAMDVEGIVESVRRECATDHVGLWRIPWHFREVEKVADVAKRRALSLEVVERLLAQEEIGVGQFMRLILHFVSHSRRSVRIRRLTRPS